MKKNIKQQPEKNKNSDNSEKQRNGKGNNSLNKEKGAEPTGKVFRHPTTEPNPAG